MSREASADPTASQVSREASGRSRLRRGLGVATLAMATATAGGVVGGLVVGGQQQDPVIVQAQPTAPPTEFSAPSNSAASTPATDIAALVDEVTPSVVRINVQTPFGPGTGTGFVTSDDGRIATNAHVVAEASQIEVEFADGTSESATLLGASRRDDLAIIEVARTGLATLPFGSSDDLRVGQPVLAIGNALGLDGGPTATDGIVSALNRAISTNDGGRLSGLIQTDAAINPGNSGGPLLTLTGEVVGINSAGTPSAQNIGFAISIDSARPILDQLEQGKPIVSAFLGVSTTVLDPQTAAQVGVSADHGLLVVDVTPGSAADTAGLLVGDVIISIDATPTDEPPQLGDVIRELDPGASVTIEVQRNNETLEVTAVLGSRTD